MAAASYRIGPSDFFTPGDLKADADTLDGQVDALDGGLRSANASGDFFDSWEAWRSGWKSYYSNNFGGFFQNLWTALNDSNRDALISYEQQFASWRDQARAAGAQLYGADINVSTGSGDSIGKQISNSGLPGIGIEIIVGLIIAVIAFEVLK
jgi:hypothetical protein